jgi:hypothetical protein
MTTKKQHFWIDREHERITTEITGEAGPAGGPRKPAVITNLSAGGLKFACDREAFNLMLPENQRIPGQVSDVEIDIQFELRTPDRENPFAICTRVRIIHTERLAQDSYTLGVQFIALSHADRDSLQSYLEAEAARRGRL